MNVTQITDGKKLTVDLLDYGARIVAIHVDQKNVVCAYSAIDDYTNDAFYMGASIGPITNRIKNSALTIDEESFTLPANEGPSCLHSGGMGFDCETWQLISASENAVEYKLTYDLSKINMRGTLSTIARYTARDNAVFIEYESQCDTTTYINLTNHVYLNLSATNTPINDHKFSLFADCYVLKDEHNVSTTNTQAITKPFHYRLEDDAEFTDFIDHHFIVKDNECDTEVVKMASIESQTSRLQLTVLSSSPGFHFYTGYFLSDPFLPSQGFCIETQTIPNAINLDGIDTPLLNPGEVRLQTTVLQFSAPSSNG